MRAARYGLICVLSLVLTPSLLDQSLAGISATSTLWVHNGSIVYLIVRGTSREFHYKQPRPGMIEAGARPGSVLFRGRTANGQYVGTAYIFDRECGPRPYHVSGPILDNHQRVVLTGQAPRLGPSPYCQIEGYSNDTLEFTLLQPGSSPARPIEKPSPGTSILVPLQKQGGTYVVPVLINDTITLKFVVDSGAADVIIPADVVSTLVRTGTIDTSDFVGTQTYRLADGSSLPSVRFRLRSLKVGGKLIEDVVAALAPAQGSLLLGQSFLERFRSWSIDNAKAILVLEPLYGEVARHPGSPPNELNDNDHSPPAAGTYSTVGDVAFLTGPGAQYAPIGHGRLPSQTAVQWHGVCQEIVDSQAQILARWCQVTYGGVTGWVPAYYLIDSRGWRLSCIMSPPTPSCLENARVQL